LAEWATTYLDYSKANHAQKNYDGKQLAFHRLFAVLNHKLPVDALSNQAAIKALRSIGSKVSGNTINCHRKEYIAAWKWGVDELGLPGGCPFAKVKKARHDKSPRYIPPLDDVSSIMDAAETQDRVMLLTMLHTGARRGEVFRLRWDDVDFDAGTIRLGTRKRKGGGMEYNLLPMTTELRKALKKHKGTATALYVFPRGQTGRPYRGRNRFMERICRRAGVRHFGFHVLRNLSASMMARAGLDLLTIQAMLRHKHTTTTNHYLRQIQGVRVDLDRVFNPNADEIQLAHEVAHGDYRG
jgi:integrase